jgi:hypothetical protein
MSEPYPWGIEMGVRIGGYEISMAENTPAPPESIKTSFAYPRSPLAWSLRAPIDHVAYLHEHVDEHILFERRKRRPIGPQENTGRAFSDPE